MYKKHQIKTILGLKAPEHHKKTILGSKSSEHEIKTISDSKKPKHRSQTILVSKALATVDLIIGLVILAAISGTVVYYVEDFKVKNDLEQISFSDRLIKDIQLTQSLALSMNQGYKITFNIDGYIISDLNDNIYSAPFSSSGSVSYPSEVEVTVAPVTHNPIYFAASGEPGYLNTNLGLVTPINTNIIIHITDGALTRNINISPQTGLVE